MCGFLATHQGYITKHKECIHKGIKYSCDQCEYHSTSQWHLKAHTQSMRRAIKYSCESGIKTGESLETQTIHTRWY